MTGPERWLIVATDMGYVVAKVERQLEPNIFHCDAGPDARFPMLIVHKSAIIAEHPNKQSADDALLRAQRSEQAARPYWQIAVQAERQAFNLMIEAARAAAQPANKVN